MYDLLLGIVIGGAMSITEKILDPIDFGISDQRIKEIHNETFNRCFSKEFLNKLEGDINNDWCK